MNGFLSATWRGHDAVVLKPGLSDCGVCVDAQIPGETSLFAYRIDTVLRSWLSQRCLR
jgi:hypothetical protein